MAEYPDKGANAISREAAPGARVSPPSSGRPPQRLVELSDNSHRAYATSRFQVDLRQMAAPASCSYQDIRRNIVVPIYLGSSKFAHVMERAGLGAAGASCGLFVAAHLAQTGIQNLSSLEFIFGMMVAGAAGFYLGIDLPSRQLDANKSRPAEGRLSHPSDTVEMLSALGTFIAPVAALVSVVYIILDVNAWHVWSVVIAIGWFWGVTMQIVAGVIARFGRRGARQTKTN